MLFEKANQARVGTLAFLYLNLLLSLNSASLHATTFGPEIRQAAPQDVIWRANSEGITAPQRRTNSIENIRALIEHSRHSGDLRALGRAKAMLDNTMPHTIEHTVLLATIEQRLHHFDLAKALYLKVLNEQPNHPQAQFSLYAVALVQGDYKLAQDLCDSMSWRGMKWIATSCKFNLIGLQGQPENAFEGLHTAIENGIGIGSAGPEFQWALATLAELAAAIDHPNTDEHYQRALTAAPKDHYSASEYSDWLLRQNRPDEAYIILEGRPDSDRLLLLRALALQAQGDSRADLLIVKLASQFEQARLRQESIHRHERARYLLDIKHNPIAALSLAELNITQQKERADRRLLERARAAVEAGR